jgi:molybdopterin converting factor small subunit
MIRVRVTAPPGCSRKRLDERGWMELPDGARLSDVLRAIRMPKILARILMVSINGAAATPDTELINGDSIAFFSIVSGG